jgi:aminoglycoside 6'-N-acetyltransferase
VIEFRPLTADDLALVEEWLGREHVARWWHKPAEESIAEYRAALEGRDPTDLYAVELGGRPIGMLQTYLVSDYPEWNEIVQVGPGVAGLDILIGEEELIGQGLGPRILTAFVRDLVSAPSVVATVEEPNRRSWRAFEKAGFRHVRDVEEDGLPHRLMRYDRWPMSWLKRGSSWSEARSSSSAAPAARSGRCSSAARRWSKAASGFPRRASAHARL